MIRLLVKTYENGKKYLCKCAHENYESYRGSGISIPKDLKVVDTTVLYETENKNEFTKIGMYYSKLWSVDINELFYNNCYELGQGGHVGEAGYEKAKSTALKKRTRDNVKLLERYMKRFKIIFEEQKSKSFKWRYQSNYWINNKLEEMYSKFGLPSEVEWNGYKAYSLSRSDKHEANRRKALSKPRARVNCPKCGLEVGSNNLNRHMNGTRCGG